MGLNLRRWRQAVATHDSWNPTHTSWGIGLSQFDLDRLGLTEGEELWSGIVATVDGKTTGNFRVMCDGEHDDIKPMTLDEKQARDDGDLAPAVTPDRELTPA